MRGEQRLVVLQIGIHHGDVARLARQHALDAGAGEPAPPDAADAAHARVGRADRARGRRGAVGRVVVDEHDFPFDAGERARELLHQQRNVVALLERRNDDAQLGRRARRACWLGGALGKRVHRAGDIAMRPPAKFDARLDACHRVCPPKEPQELGGVRSLRHLFNETIVRLVEGLADPARRRRAALLFVLGYGALWFVYGVIAKSSQDLNADMAEMVVWTRELALGYPKHPPLLAWILWVWFKVFPLADWAYILLAVVTVAVGIYLAIELAAEWLSRREARGGAVPARRDPVLQFPRPEVRPELDPDSALGARDVGDAARARHAPCRLGGAWPDSPRRPRCC